MIQYEDDVCDSVRKCRLWSSLIMTFVIQSIFGGVAGVFPAEGVARNEVRAQGETSPPLPTSFTGTDPDLGNERKGGEL